MNDIILQVNGVEIKGKDILSAVDEIIKLVKETNDLDGAANALRTLKGLEKTTGKGVAKLLAGLQEWWKDTGQEEMTGDAFEDWAYSIDTEFNSTYLKRCISIEKYESNGTFSERIISHPIKEKQAIASHLDQDYPISKKEWKELERATSEYEVGEILRKSKGKPPRKNTLSITLERDGTLSVWYQGETFFRGYLVPINMAVGELEKEAFEKSLARLTKNTGVKVQ